MNRKALRSQIDQLPSYLWQLDEHGATNCKLLLDSPHYEIVNISGCQEFFSISVKGEVSFSEADMGETFKQNYLTALREGQSGGWKLASVSISPKSLTFMFTNWGISTWGEGPAATYLSMTVADNTSIWINDIYHVYSYHERLYLMEKLNDHRYRRIEIVTAPNGRYIADVTDYCI
jgi:hypothetical protein